MHRRPPFALLLVAFVAFHAASARAAPRDAAAKKKIDLAINEHYVTTKFDQAEAMLVGAISACGGQCSPAVTATAWMYVGLVRGSGKNNQKGAKEAFANALASDPGVSLDDGLATPKTKKTFAAAKREAGASSRPATGAGTVELGEGTGEGGGAVDCSLKVSEVQTRRPIPIACTAPDEAKKVELKYKLGEDAWKGVKMKRKKGVYQATIPCTATQRPGALRFYVRAEDASGDPLQGYGKKSKPEKISIVKQSEEDPPAFPDKEPPARCARSEATEAASCSDSDDCEGGARCVEGTCRAAKRRAGPVAENWLGLHFAYDLAFVSGAKVCSQDSQRNQGFACFYEGTEEQYRFEAHPTYANDITSGLAPATARALMSYDRLIGENVTAGVRLGYAFGGGPASGKKKEAVFLPYHTEVRASYWFGEAPFATPGLRPYVGAQGGAAQVDAKLPVKVGDCGGVPGGPPSKPGAQLAQDAVFYQACSTGAAIPVPLMLDAYKKLGKAFAGIHAGVLYAVSRDGGIQLEVKFMQMMPTTGQVIEPSIGYVFGL